MPKGYLRFIIIMLMRKPMRELYLSNQRIYSPSLFITTPTTFASLP